MWTALGMVSVLFGIMHWISRAYAVFATILGFYLGWLWIASGNLLVPIVAHGLYDFVALVYVVKMRPPLDDEPPTA
jgi:membrane protease YdiL (CAAX protease family)